MFFFTVKPRKVKILISSDDDYLSIRSTHKMQCESFGSYPSAKIVWLLGSVQLNNSVNTVSYFQGVQFK